MEAYIQEQDNSIEIHDLEDIREKVEAMNKFNQVEVLRILQNKGVTLNENKYGVHINLSELETFVIEELKTYIEYVNNQELDLNELEEKKETFKNAFFSKAKTKPSLAYEVSSFEK